MEMKEVYLLIINFSYGIRIGVFSTHEKASEAQEVIIKENKFGGSDNFFIQIISQPIDGFDFVDK